jgi:hypothetical protein
MSYDAKILADSISPDGVRLTTVQATFPRFILAEVNTHRVLSRNSASSRAIPTEKLIERVASDPFIPATFNKRVKGMGVGEAFDEATTEQARAVWLRAISKAIYASSQLAEIGLDKSRANRVLEPFMWHTAILTGTEWGNFFALRDHPDAQGEFQVIAHMLREVMDASTPAERREDDWHLPLISDRERTVQPLLPDEPLPDLFLPLASSGRCAKVSFDTHENFEDPWSSYERAEMLGTKGHWSPHEHPARPMVSKDLHDDNLAPKILVPASEIKVGVGTLLGPDLSKVWCGNLRGWVSLRKLFVTEHDFSLT